MLGDTEGLKLLFLQFGILKLSQGGCWRRGAETLVQSRLKSHLLCSWFYSRMWSAERILDQFSRIGGKINFFFNNPEISAQILEPTKYQSKRVQDFIFLFLILIKGMRRRGEFKIFISDPRNGKILFRSFASCSKIENVLWKWGVEMCLDRECVEFVIIG